MAAWVHFEWSGVVVRFRTSWRTRQFAFGPFSTSVFVDSIYFCVYISFYILPRHGAILLVLPPSLSPGFTVALALFLSTVHMRRPWSWESWRGALEREYGDDGRRLEANSNRNLNPTLGIFCVCIDGHVSGATIDTRGISLTLMTGRIQCPAVTSYFALLWKWRTIHIIYITSLLLSYVFLYYVFFMC